MNSVPVQPWYREPWPWILMAGPAIVVVAGVITAVVAWRTNDVLVADDYYKEGLAINRVLARDKAAARLGISAAISFNADRMRVRILLSGQAAPNKSIKLSLLHPTRGGLDQVVELPGGAGSLYEGSMAPVARGEWRLQLEDAEGAWRLTGLWNSAQDGIALGRPGN